jgi:hypothetical protein
MESAKYKLARQSAGYGIDPTALVYLADLMMAIELVMTKAAGLAKANVSKWLKLLRLSVTAICASLGDCVTPENLLIQDLIDSRAEIRDKLRKTHTSGEATHHGNHLRLLFAFARGMGVKHELFGVEQEWEQLPFFGKDRAAQMVIIYLIDRLIHPKEVTEQNFKDFRAARREDYSIPATNQAIAYLKMRIRELVEPKAEFLLLDLSSAQEGSCRLALKNMDLTLRTEVEAAMAWLAEEVAPGIIRMSESTRQHFLMLLEILCGFANWLPRVGTITSLSDCLNRPIITVYARWLHYTKRANQISIKTRIYSLHAFLAKYPPFADQDWSWISSTRSFPGQQTVAAPTLVAEFPKEPESAIVARRRDRAFDYDYDTIDHLPELMQKRRESDSSRSKVEIGRMLHDECLMGWLGYYPLPPRCMYECRINGDNPNLFRASDYPHLVPDSIARTKHLHLVSDDMWVLRFAAEEVPNREPIDGPLPDQLVPALIRYRQYRSLLIHGEDPGTLFLNRDGGALRASTFSKLVGNISESYLGKRIPPSAFRDIAAYKYLSWKPGDYYTLASLLCQSEHNVRMRYDLKYRREHSSKPHCAGHAA